MCEFFSFSSVSLTPNLYLFFGVDKAQHGIGATLTVVYAEACDAVQDGTIDLSDYNAVRDYVAGTGTIAQTMA